MEAEQRTAVDAIEAAKRASTLQILFRAARLVNEQGLARLRAATGLDIRPAHTNLFPHIDLEGTRLTVLARRVGVSKQAVGQLVDQLVAMGALERVPDPSDGRARLIRFATTAEGEHGVLVGLRHLAEYEEELAAAVGPQRWASLRDALIRLLAVVEDGGPP